ncbi:hypothetical protein T4D_14822 [Trichinella pseudospiralis]|uniref:Uncharacterized protein n=1 Tax=Trichinella pseudospiralis TaxID=6337 RepID=A0A0V1G3L4_TRIPS|nr:hypothetical protein T4D_14822 [Trichinella pseudospiralis]
MAFFQKSRPVQINLNSSKSTYSQLYVKRSDSKLIYVVYYSRIKALLFLKIVLYLENIHILNIKNSKQRVKHFSNFTNAENIIDL